MNDIVDATVKFDEDMINPENYEIGSKYFNAVVTVDDWAKVQYLAKKKLDNEHRPADMWFLKRIINGVIPCSLRITKKNIMKNIR